MSFFKKDPPEDPWGSPLFVISQPPAKSPEEQAWRLEKIQAAIDAKPDWVPPTKFQKFRTDHPVLIFYASLYGFFALVGWAMS